MTLTTTEPIETPDASNSGEVKIIIALNKSLEMGVALNAAAHAALGLAARAAIQRPEALAQMNFLNFADANGNEHAFISARSLIVLRASGGELRKLRAALRADGLLTVDFTDTMTGQTYVEQIERSQSTPEEALVYYAVAAFGSKSVIDIYTRKLSLWRSSAPSQSGEA